MIAIDQQQCNGCRDCATVCPHAVIEMRERKAYLVAEERCIECGACELNCHYDAIQVTKGTGCLFIIIRDDILKIGPNENAVGCC